MTAYVETEVDNAMDQAIGRAFLTSILITRSAEGAEAAVMQALESCEAQSEENLVRHAIEASIDSDRFCEDLPTAFSIIPPEMWNVLQLPMLFRRCFVLRILARIPANVCAPMLDLTALQVDNYTNSALEQLPALG